MLTRSECVDLVGRGGLEPPTSAVTGPERCAYDLRKLEVDERCSRFYLVSAATTICARLAVSKAPGPPMDATRSLH